MSINWKQILVKLSGIHTDLTKQQQKRVPFKNEKGKDTPLQAEFTGDKFSKGGDVAKTDVSAWKEQNSQFKKLDGKGNPDGGKSVNDAVNWRNLGSALTNDKAGRAETVESHEELAQGSAPTYKTGTKYRVGSKFSSRVSKNLAVLQDMGTFSKFKEKIASKQCVYVSPTGEAQPANENLIVVAYIRPERNDGAVLLTPLGNFVASFEHVEPKFSIGPINRPASPEVIELDRKLNEILDTVINAGANILVAPAAKVIISLVNKLHDVVVNKSTTASFVQADYTVLPEKVEDKDEKQDQPFDKNPDEGSQETSSDPSEMVDIKNDVEEVPEGGAAYVLGDDGKPRWFTVEDMVDMINSFKGEEKTEGEVPEEHANEKDSDAGLHGESSWKTLAKSPPHSEYTVHEMKKHRNKIDNPFALAWWMKNKGMHLHDKKPKESSWKTILKSIADYAIPETGYGSNFDEEGVHIPYRPGNTEVQKGSRVLDIDRKLHGTVLHVEGLAAVVEWDELGTSDIRSTQKLEVMASKKTAAKKPYYCSTCDSGFSEGQMNFHKNHEYEKRGEGKDSVEDEGSEESKLRKEDEAHMKSKEAANIEFQKKPDGTVNISMEDTPAGMSDVVNGMPTGGVPQPQPAVPPQGAEQAPAPATSAKGKKASADLTYEDGYRNGHLDKVNGIKPLEVALNYTSIGYSDGYYDGYNDIPKNPTRNPWLIGESVKDAELGNGTIESINGEEVIASFSGKKYKTTLSALG